MEGERLKWDGQYIQDKDLFNATCFANQLYNMDGKTMEEALKIACAHYKLPTSTVALELMVNMFIKKHDQGM